MKGTSLFTVIVAALSLFCSCEKDNSFVIDGTVYGGRNFEDQTIYLTPLSAACVHDCADSATIHDGHFRFEGIADQDGVYVIRLRPMMKLFIGEPFVIKEPGHIRVKLNQVSTVCGTPQNDSLQAWCNFKAQNDSLLTDIKKKIKRASPREFDSLIAQRDSIKNIFERRCRDVVSQNQNAFGEFVDKWYVR